MTSGEYWTMYIWKKEEERVRFQEYKDKRKKEKNKSDNSTNAK